MELFRLPLFAGYRFVGNSDRWNHYLSFAAFHSDNFSRGTFSAWCDYLFMGFDSLAQPFSFVSPLFALPALLGTDDVIRVFGYVSPVILVATLSAAYLVLYSMCRDRLAAVAGACIYGLSTWSLLKLTHNDNSYLAVFVSPILFYLVHTTDSKNLGRRVAVLTIIVWICLYWSFLNYFAYLPIFLFAYAAWRWHEGARHPVVALAASMAIATILAVPRLLVLFESLKGSTRTAGGTSEYVGTVLFLRYLEDKHPAFLELVKLATSVASISGEPLRGQSALRKRVRLPAPALHHRSRAVSGEGRIRVAAGRGFVRLLRRLHYRRLPGDSRPLGVSPFRTSLFERFFPPYTIRAGGPLPHRAHLKPLARSPHTKHADRITRKRARADRGDSLDRRRDLGLPQSPVAWLARPTFLPVRPCSGLRLRLRTRARSPQGSCADRMLRCRPDGWIAVRAGTRRSLSRPGAPD